MVYLLSRNDQQKGKLNIPMNKTYWISLSSKEIKEVDCFQDGMETKDT